MPDLKFVAQFPIEDESVPMAQLHAEAQKETIVMIHQLGFGMAGPFGMELLDLPLATFVQCTVHVQPFQFPGVK
ncbi:hypothetical protein [Arthrobacter sp. lap29]|uniref:hypothetical protein n=1 Tax=Arthrobacter sp. lap29 TaxID=3056122 RepID=UPI0028F71775|nr:hypothetical protein [Arthrobacter sp. lap29]